MNRRNLLKLTGQAAIALVAVQCASILPQASPRSDRIATINRMITESGSWWMQVRDRENGKNPALVYFGDGPAFEVSRNAQQLWQIRQRGLTKAELMEFNNYIQSITPHCGTTIGKSAYGGGDYNLRAWIKNGRRPEWNMSIEGINPKFNER